MAEYNDEPYLRSEDLLVGGKYVTATVEIEEVLEGCPLTRKLKEHKGIALKLKGKEKVLGLGLTNEQLLKVVCGDCRPSEWKGKTIKLEVRKVRGKTRGTTQPAIRIMPPPGTEMRSGLIKELGESYG